MFTPSPAARFTSPPAYTYTYRPSPSPASSHRFSFGSTTPTSKGANGYHHTRRASHGPTSSYHPPPPYRDAPTGYYPRSSTPSRNPSFVSHPDRIPRATADTRRSAEPDGIQRRSSSRRKSFSSKHPHVDYVYGYSDVDEGYWSTEKDRSPPPPYCEYDRFGYPIYTNAPRCEKVSTSKPVSSESKRKPSSSSSRQRSASFSSPTVSAAARPRSSHKPKSPPQATAADAARAHIPAGFSYKNWDPTEEPILLLGSVFDANSLGKWIFDWTVYHHGANTPLADVAGDLWLLLIQLAGKIKRAEDCLPRVRYADRRELIEDFLESGERLWDRFSSILKHCEEYMWRAAKKEASRRGKSHNGPLTMGPKSGCEFVDTIFGRDRKLDDTQKLMASIRLWSHRFDANCEAILRSPSG